MRPRAVVFIYYEEEHLLGTAVCTAACWRRLSYSFIRVSPELPNGRASRQSLSGGGIPVWSRTVTPLS